MSADRFRTFGDTFGKGAPAFFHIADTGVIFTNADGQLTTGAWRAATPADIGSTTSLNVSGLSLTVGSVAVTGNPLMTVSNVVPIPVSGVSYIGNTAPINVSGWVTTILTGGSVTMDSTSIVSAQASGNNLNVISNQLLSGISGRLSSVVPISGIVTANVSIGAVAVTGGNINISNGVVPVSGIVTATVSSGPIVDAQASGNNLALTANVLLSGISGALAGNLTDVALVNDVTGNLYLAAISGLLGTNLTSAAWVTGAVSITNTAPINVSGWVTTIVTGGTLSFDSSAIVNAQVTGNNLTVTSNVLLSGISGIFASNISGPSWVTGSVSSSNPVGVTGVKTDTNVSIFGSPAVPYALVPMGGRAVAATGAGSITGGYNTGDYVMFSFNKDNGGLMCNQGNLDYTQDFVTVTQSGVASVSNQAVSGVSSGAFAGQVLFQANPNRLGWYVQNLHTGALMLRFSTSLPSTGLMNVLLKGGSTLNDGNGASWSDMPCIFRGPVSCSGLGGSPALYTAWEI